MKRLLRQIALSALAITPLYAGPIDQWFEQANHWYQQEQFDSADVYYRKCIDAGMVNAALYYNLGNTCFRRHRMGEAILYYERARRLAPVDADILHNLRFVRANIVDRIAQPEQGFVESVLRVVHTAFALQTQLWALIALLTLMAILIALMLFTSRNARLWLSYLLGMAGVLCVMLGVSATLKIHYAERVVDAVILSPSVDAYNAPQGDKVLFVAHEGSTVRVRRRMDEWSLISLPNGISGWVAQRYLEEV